MAKIHLLFSILAVALLCLSAPSQVTSDIMRLNDQTCGILWERNLPTAMARAKLENKPLLVTISARKFANKQATGF